MTKAITAEALVKDLLEIQNRFPDTNITRDFYRSNSVYSDDWSKLFGTFQEFKRQAGLLATRAQQKVERQISKHVDLDQYRKFYKEEILPFHQKYSWTDKVKGRYKRILVASDFHDIESDRFMLDVFIDTAHRIQPDVICLAGDVFDNYEMSRFNIDPRQFDIQGRFDFVKKMILGRLRLVCPKSQIDFIIGNHEWRILKLLAEGRNPAVKILLSDVLGLSLKDIFGLDQFQINLVAKFDLSAFQIDDVQEELKQNYQVYYDTFAVTHIEDKSIGLSGCSGHTHRPKQSTFQNHPMGKLTWTEIGCMSKTDAEYIEKSSNWQNSFLLVTIDREKKTASHNHILVPGDFVVVEGKLYERVKREKGN